MNASMADVAVVGAGPYGLSVAAHAAALGLDVVVFGEPMGTWARNMPRGMLLKSEPQNSGLAAPGNSCDFIAFCEINNLPCARSLPIPVERFVDYGRWFQRQAVPNLDPSMVTAVRTAGGGFALELAGGDRARARAVVLAVGVVPFARRPEQLAAFPPALASHTIDHNDFGGFGGRDVTVIGAGQAALETAVLLDEAGARVRLVARADRLRWNGVPLPRRPLRDRLLAPESGLGTGWRTWVYANAPHAVRHLPAAARRHIARTALGPAGAWWLRDRFVDRVPALLGYRITDAAADGDRVRLSLTDAGGRTHRIDTDHVVCGTGFEVDLRRLSLLDPVLADGLRRDGAAPWLSAHFETSMPGLYAVGLLAKQTFGPGMQFVQGTAFAARRVAAHLARTLPRRSVAVPAEAAGTAAAG
ncbi:YpdA family putative bacillithiol disulfide reductase [Actinomadura keratinilytica]|uniref:YpdA family putative bacillithiol disulfide reductase n=1 Tax=Actinomadura keratinilytica TaxID=547461 RepID=A0ABP7Z067_9ACTN